MSAPARRTTDMNARDLQKTAKFILDTEARRDRQGRLSVYKLPSGDGGGTFEVAGINDRYDHDEAHELRRLIQAGKHKEAEVMALAYYIENTDGVKNWSEVAAIEAFLRDACFNRGKGGAAKILQIALGVKVDGSVGPKTLAALRVAEERSPLDLIHDMHAACDTYERRVAPPVGKRAKFFEGLQNRWRKRTDFALSFL